MAEAGSFADRVKQQADIVRVIGEYVRLKKSGQNFTGCARSTRKKLLRLRCTGEADLSLLWLRRGGDVFKFVMEMEKSHVPGSGAHRGGKMRHRDSASRANARPKSAAKISSAPRWWKCIARRRHFLREHCCRVAEGKAALALSGGSRARSRSDDAVRPGLCASGGDALLRF